MMSSNADGRFVREIGIFVPLVVLTLLFGFWPKPVLDMSSASVDALVAQDKPLVVVVTRLGKADERTFQALGDRTRLRILALLSTGEVCVCDIHESLDLPQPKVSRQMAKISG